MKSLDAVCDAACPDSGLRLAFERWTRPRDKMSHREAAEYFLSTCVVQSGAGADEASATPGLPRSIHSPERGHGVIELGGDVGPAGIASKSMADGATTET